MTKNWRTEVDSTDFFGNQKKSLAMSERRPTSRVSDVVGPGISGSAVRIVDFNERVATFNGYYSALDGALDAPASGAFVGYTVMDSELGGTQVFTSLSTGIEYTRIFLRNPSDADFIVYGTWKSSSKVPSTAVNTAAGDMTAIPISTATALTMPPEVSIATTGIDTFAISGTQLLVQRPGVYSGVIRAEFFPFSGTFTHLTELTLRVPDGAGTRSEGIGVSPSPIGNGFIRNFVFSCTGSTGFIDLKATQTQNASFAIGFISHVSVVRQGDVA